MEYMSSVRKLLRLKVAANGVAYLEGRVVSAKVA